MTGVLKISEAANLAIHAVTYIASNNDHKVSTKELASFHNVSEAHLSKVLQRLVKSGFLKSVRGPKGGFVIAKPFNEIKLLDIYEVFEGIFTSTNCLFETPVCGRKTCVFGDLFQELNIKVINYLSRTLYDVIQSEKGISNAQKNNQD